MDQRLKEHINPKSFMIGLAAFFLLFGIGVVFVSDFLIVPLAAFYALVLWFFKDNKLFCSLLPLPILALSVFDGIGAILASCFALCVGLLLWWMYQAHLSKFDTAFAITAVFTLYLLLALFFAVGEITKEYTFDAFFAYYAEFIETQQSAFVSAFSEFHVVDESGANVYLFTEEIAEEMFLSVIRLMLAFFVIAAFFICGLTCKIFSRVVRYAEKEEEKICAWRFLPPNIMVYFYLASYVASFFAASGESVFGSAVQNIFYIFMAVFAYMGMQHLLSVISKVERKGFMLLVIVALLIFLNISAVQILSFFGAYATIGKNRAKE